MAPILVRAQSAYRDIRVHSFHHTHARTHARTHTHARAQAHTHTHAYTIQIHTLLVMDWYKEKKTTDQYAEDKRWGFSFDLKEESEDECLTERGMESQITGPVY